LPHRGDDTDSHSDRYADEHRPQPQNDRFGKAGEDVIVYIVVLVLEGGAEVSSHDVEHISSILLDQRFVEVIFRLDVPSDDVGEVSFGGKGSSGSDPDYEEA